MAPSAPPSSALPDGWMDRGVMPPAKPLPWGRSCQRGRGCPGGRRRTARGVTGGRGGYWGRTPPPQAPTPTPRAHPDSPARPARLWGQPGPGCSDQGHPKHEGEQLGATGPAPYDSKGGAGGGWGSLRGLRAPMPSPSSTHAGSSLPHIALGARRPFWSREASVTLQHTEWHHQPPYTSPFPHPIAGEQRGRPHGADIQPGCAVGTPTRDRDRATFSPLALATLVACRRSSGASAGRCGSSLGTGTGRGAGGHRLPAGRAHRALLAHPGETQLSGPAPSPQPPAPQAPCFALTFSPRSPAGPGAPW